MKKRYMRFFCVILALAVLTACLSGCGGSSSSGSGGGEELGELSVRFAHGSTLDHPVHLASLQMQEYVSRVSGGKINIEIFPNSQLGGEREVVEQVKNGTLDFAMTTVGPLTTFDKYFMVLDIPFLFNTYEEAWMVLDSNVGMKLADTLEDEGLIFMSWLESGFRHITNSVRPIVTPDDLKGLKIRTMEATMHMANFSALGANPTPIPWPELYLAMSQRLADGQENPLANIWDIKLYEVQKYITLDGHLYDTAVNLSNRDWFGGLPVQAQKIIREGFVMCQNYSRFCQYNRELELVDYLAQKGMEVTELTAAQKQAFADVSQSAVIGKVKEEIGADFVDNFLAEVDARKAEIMQGVSA